MPLHNSHKQSKTYHLYRLIEREVYESKYFINIVDDFTRYGTVRYMQYKSETYAIIQHYIYFSKEQGYGPIKRVRTYCRTEFMYVQLQQLFSAQFIRHEPAAPRNPEQNGIVKRANRILYEKT